MLGRNKRRRLDKLYSEEAEEPVYCKRRQDGNLTEAGGCAGRVLICWYVNIYV